MNQNIITFGNIEIRWYSVLLLLAFIIGIILIEKQGKKQNINLKELSDLCFYLIVFCIIGARIYYVLFNLDYYSQNILSIFKIWEGGLAIHGGIISGIIFLIFYTKKKNIQLLKLTDIIVPSLILGQAIGRWGNFFNQEAYGAVTTYNNLKNLHIPNFIIKGMYINHKYWQPTFLYESIGCLLGFIILLVIRKYFKPKQGYLTSIYCIIYGIIRFLIESLRQDSLMLLNLKMAQIISILMIIIGIIIIIYINMKGNKNDK